MAEKMRARVIGVRVDRHGGSLAVAAEIGDETLQVKDAGDFTAPGALLVDDDAGTLLDYTAVTSVEDGDPSDLASPDAIALAAPLAAAIPTGTSLWVYEADDDDDPIVAEVIASCIPEDDEDAAETGEPISATVPRDYQDDLPPGERPAPGVPVVLEWDDDVEEWAVARIRGKGSRAIHFEHAEPAYTPISGELTAGTFARQLLHRNIAAEHGLFTTINGVALGSAWWTLDAAAGVVTVTIPDWVADAPSDRREFGWPMYAYRRGIAVEAAEVDVPEPVPFSVVGTSMAHGVNWSSINWPGGTEDTDIFVLAQLARGAATNACTDPRASFVASEPTGLDMAKIWTGTVTDASSALVAAGTDLGGVQEAVYGLLVLRPDRPISVDLARVSDSGPQGSGDVPALSGTGSGAVGVGFSTAGIGGTAFHDWHGTPWEGYVDNGNYGRISFVTQSTTTVAATAALTSDTWRGFALGLELG